MDVHRGLSGFALASAVGGAAQSFVMLTGARAFQGAFGALLAPAALSLLTTTSTETSLRSRFGPRPLVVVGVGLGAMAMLMLRGIGMDSSYAGDILPALVIMGAGLGLVFSTVMNNATLGVAPADAGVASATVSAAQQIGASLGTALLSTLAASTAAGFVAGHRPTPALMAQAAIHGYTTAFTVSSGIFAAAAVIAGLLFTHQQERPVVVAEAVLAA